ncbi:iron uptake porin [Scytonema hofmannii FACHB-248]|uniref:Iron uptake porin n=1 Tax=Scytonema hofmannii FACHB-248 TaxID=1842502 RepID=A0ABR8GWV6_9CYAN|nr:MULTISPECIES: iron uptake porin [Nostocales]MBD2608010.1 iron uptake porin [Scytonema hofmannii FACHB-248]
MSNLLWKSLVVSPAVLGATLLVSATAIAAPTTTTQKAIQTETLQTEKSEVTLQADKLEILPTVDKLEASKNTSKGIVFPTAATEVAQKQEVAQVQNSTVFSTSTATTVGKKPQVLAQVEQTQVNTLDQVNKYGNEGKNGNSLAQVTSVSQFSDVQPTDWAFQALQSLVERYGCIAGYPNGTYRGNRALTRYEFAAGLNACLDRVNELIATATADLVTKEDLATLQRLQEEFSAELATLRGRVDALEARSAELESNQFSTTTKLVGEAIFALSDVFGDRAGDRNNTVFQERIRLDLQTSFTGKDVLHTRLATGNAGGFDLGSLNSGAQGFQTFNLTGRAENDNAVVLDWLAYYVPIGPARLYVSATGGVHSDYAATVNPYFEDYDGGNGALSTFASENPIFRIGGGAGAALNFNFGKDGGILKPSGLTLGYLGSEPNNPGIGQGIFNGNYAALGQLNFNLGDRVALAATYVHGYHGAGSALFDAGGFQGQNVPVVGTSQANTILNPSSSNSYGLSAAVRPSDKLSISGFVSYSDVTGFGSNDNFEAWSYGAGIALPDFGKKGNVLGIFGGAEPYALGRGGRGSRDIPYHVEGFYKYRVSDNVSITPGVIWLTSPGQNSDNSDAFIGTLRTTFTF